MTLDEARIVAAVVATADGECHVCAAHQTEQLIKLLPEHDWLALVARAGDWEPELLKENFR